VFVDGFEVNSTTTGAFINFNTSTVVDFKMMNGTVIGAAGAGYTVLQNSAITRALISNVVCKNAESLFRQNAGATMSELMIENCYLDTCNLGVNSIPNMTISATNFRANALTNKMFQVNSGTVRINMKNCAAPAGKVILFNVGGSVISYSNSDAAAGIDMGNPAITTTGETPQAGDLHWNINATTAGLYGWTLAGAWAKLF